MLRAYARPYPHVTAGTPQVLSFDSDSGTMNYLYTTRLPNKRVAGRASITEIFVPPANYPGGYTVQIEGGVVASPAGSSILRVRNNQSATAVSITVNRVGTLPPLVAPAEPINAAVLAALPPIPDAPLTRNSLIGHIVSTPGGRRP